MLNSEEIAYKSITAFFKLIGFIPRKWAVRLGNFMGQILFWADRKHRMIAIDNLTRAFGDEKSPTEIKMLARRVFKNLVQIIFEIGWSLNLDSKDFPKYFVIEGLSNYKRAYKKNKGVLGLTAHIGNWELLPIVEAMIGYPLNIIYRPLDLSFLNQFFIMLRSRFGAKTTSKANSMFKIFKSLKQGEIIGMLMDQNVDWYEGVFVDFFGQRACTNKGLALLALKTGAPVVPVFLVREGEGFKAEFGSEVPLIKTGDKTKDIEANTQQYNKIIEEFICRYPDQWFWVHQRWKTKPFCRWPRSD